MHLLQGLSIYFPTVRSERAGRGNGWCFCGIVWWSKQVASVGGSSLCLGGCGEDLSMVPEPEAWKSPLLTLRLSASTAALEDVRS
jgi:hypothetical protein